MGIYSNVNMKLTLIQGDCLKVLPTLPDKSIDLVLTDPPYNLNWKTCITFKTRKNLYWAVEENLLEWDKVDLKSLWKKLAPEFDRLVKETGSVITFAPYEWSYYMFEEMKKNNFEFKTLIVWEKTNPVPQVRKRNYLITIECIVWFARPTTKKAKYTFNFKTQKEMKNIIKHPIVGGKERTIHPTQKPEKLIKHLLEIHSNPNDTILDPFLGSGTTMKVAKDLGRNCIGIEINPKYIELTKKRLNWGCSLSNDIEWEFKIIE